MKTFIKKLAAPAVILQIALAAISSAALFYVFANNLDNSYFAYSAYVISAYTLIVLVLSSIRFIKKAKAAVYSHPFGKQYLTNLNFRGCVSLAAAFAVNTAYALFELVNAAINQSLWYGALGAYYLILAAARFVLLNSLYKKADKTHQLKAALLCGRLLLGLNIALSLVTAQMVLNGKGYTYLGSLIFAAAFYAFYSVAAAIINLVRFRKLKSPALSASKVISIATALVSMLSLQTAMFSSFGGEFQFQRLMNGLTGGAVCTLLFFTALLMIIKIKKQL